MKCKSVWWPVRFAAILVLGLGAGALAQAPTPVQFSGFVSDYSPSNVTPPGPWEIRGQWSLQLTGQSGTASFSAALTMETSDYGITEGIVSVNDPATRGPHTHHITMTDATVTSDTSVCPANSLPTTGSGLVVSGPVRVTANGSPGPFEAKGPSMLQVCITGGSEVKFSNITLKFAGPATGHFGAQPIHGVVLEAK